MCSRIITCAQRPSIHLAHLTHSSPPGQSYIFNIDGTRTRLLCLITRKKAVLGPRVLFLFLHFLFTSVYFLIADNPTSFRAMLRYLYISETTTYFVRLEIPFSHAIHHVFAVDPVCYETRNKNEVFIPLWRCGFSARIQLEMFHTLPLDRIGPDC
jgi:hypothetical protein